jgi:hypothetical protein
MISWNYRVFREDNGDYIIREVFYDDNGAICGCSEDAVEPFGSSFEELVHDIDAFKEALTMPVLTLQDIPSVTQPDKASDRGGNLSRAKLEALLDEVDTVKQA